MSDTLTYNASAAYQFGPDHNPWLRRTKVRLGVINLTNLAPPLASGAFGYNPGLVGNIFVGRTWTLEVSRNF